VGEQVLGFDHLVLRVADVERSLAWYRDRLGLAVERDDEWRRGEVLFPSVRIDAGTVIDLLAGERSGTNVDHLCLVLADFDPDAAAVSGEWDVAVEPMDVWGARGMGRSLYVHDPDGNVVELRSYPAS
jgi:catechol 2,3-dioxygenase-like lactoylglutathione lyase family enzyme